MVAREVRSRNVTKTSLRQYFQDLLQAIISSSPMIVLGCARLIATWGVRYQEHVTEYGVHWNFFFTLAIVKVSVVSCINILSYISWPHLHTKNRILFVVKLVYIHSIIKHMFMALLIQVCCHFNKVSV